MCVIALALHGSGVLLLGVRFRSYHNPVPGTAGELGCCAILAAYAAAWGRFGRITSGTAGESGGAMLSGLCLYLSRDVDSGDPMRRSGALFDLNCVAQRTIGWCVSLSTPCEASGEVRHVLM